MYQNAWNHILEEKLSSQLQLSATQICSRQNNPAILDRGEMQVTCESVCQFYDAQ